MIVACWPIAIHKPIAIFLGLLKYKTPLLITTVALLLAGCANIKTPISAELAPTKIPTSIQVNSTPAFATPALTQEPAPAVTEVKITPTDTPKIPATLTPTATSVPGLINRCLDVSIDIPENYVSTGNLILDSREEMEGWYSFDTYWLNMETRSITNTNQPNENCINFATTLDRKWLAYERVLFDETTGDIAKSELVIIEGNSQQEMVIPWEDGWVGITGWFERTQLIIKSVGKTSDENDAQASTLMILNPFTGERQILTANFPNMYDWSPVPDFEYWGLTYYDPTMTRVAYLGWVEPNRSFSWVLWDLENQVTLANPVVALFPLARWAPDGSQYLITSLPEEDQPFELYSVHRDGQVQKLTNLTSHFDRLHFLNYAWSPDGRYIALLWTTSYANEKNRLAEVAVYDTQTGLITNYCIPIKYGGAGYGEGYPQSPIWSPDSTQFIVTDWYQADKRRVILVDIVNEMAVQIFEDAVPMGWLVHNNDG